MGTRLLMEWPWFPPLTSSSNTFYARCIPTKRMQGRYRDGNGMLGRVWRRQSHKIQSPSRPRALPQLRQEPRTLMGSCLRLIYLADSIPDRLGTGWWSCFCYVPLAGVRKSTNKQGDLTRRNISTRSKRKKNRWITPGIHNRVSARSRARCQPRSIKVTNSLRRGSWWGVQMSVVS